MRGREELGGIVKVLIPGQRDLSLMHDVTRSYLA